MYVTLVKDTFVDGLGGQTTGWITNLPAGLNAVATKTGNTTAKIEVSGTSEPYLSIDEPLEITIPALALNSGVALPVPPNPAAEITLEK